MVQRRREGADAAGELELGAVIAQATEHAGGAELSAAQALLASIWHRVSHADPYLADHAAWGLAWHCIGAGKPEEAYRWFQRIGAHQQADDPFWATVRLQLHEFFTELRRGIDDGSATGRADASEPAILDAIEPLTIRTLGAFAITRGEALLPPCQSRKATAILRYLLTRRHALASTSELAELLWPEIDPQRAVHNVHVAINALRRHIDQPGRPSFILARGGSYCINPAAPIVNQVEPFEHTLRAAEQAALAGFLEQAGTLYAQALTLYEGDYFVDDHDLVWAVVERERILSLYLNGLQRYGDLMVELGSLEQAIRCYTTLLMRDPYREDVHAKLMLCYIRLGRRSDALQQYAQCAATLAEGLGIKPGPSLQALYECVIPPTEHQSAT